MKPMMMMINNNNYYNSDDNNNEFQYCKRRDDIKQFNDNLNHLNTIIIIIILNTLHTTISISTYI